MDNDNKVKSNELKKDTNKIHQEVMLFLGDELNRLHQSKSNKYYDLSKEYEKTKKNKSPFVLIIIAGTLLVVLGIAFFMHRVITSHNQEITVSLQEFSDLNLRALLDRVSVAQSNYDNAVKNKAQIEADMETKLKDAELKHENDVYVLDSMNIRYKKVYNDRLAIIDKEYEANVQAIHAEYDEVISSAEKEVLAYQEQLAQFDTSKLESAREQEKALDSERQLRDLETKKITDRYDSRISDLENTIRDLREKHSEEMRTAVAQVSKKYQEEIDALDPTLRDSYAREIIDDAKESQKNDFNAADIINQKSINDPKVLDFVSDYQDLYDNFKYLDDVVASIPQKNSIPHYVSAARSLVNDMGKTFMSTTIDFYEETESLNRELNQKNQEIVQQKNYYEESLTNLLTIAKTSAIILSAGDIDSIIVFVTPKARYLITEEGAQAEIRLTKGLKGTIIQASEGNFLFKIAPDKDGQLPEIDMSEIVPGTLVKILEK
ncbi:MAG: hypothetical protein K6C97_03675 [Treponema sp.]|nr:hypothetical protein [Treponema sp.]